VRCTVCQSPCRARCPNPRAPSNNHHGYQYASPLDLKSLPKINLRLTSAATSSQLANVLQGTGRRVIIRGASTASPKLPSQAAVSILESPFLVPKYDTSLAGSTLALSPSSLAPSQPLSGSKEEESSQTVFGLCRFAQIAPRTVLMDMTIRLPSPTKTGLIPSPHVFDVYVSATGNLIDPPHTTGRPLVSLGRIQPDEDGYGDLFRDVEGELRDWIGRACVVEAMACVQTSPVKSAAGRIFTGVVARSAGAWGNEKTVCSCSGSTVWEEVRDVAKKGEL
jgi:hypothetical protein